MQYRLGVDIGGTFTDFVLEDIVTGMLRAGKVLTTPGDPDDAVVGVVIHGTTLATNAVIERKEYRVGSAGAGRQRGGFGQEVRVRSVAPGPITVSMMTDRLKHAPRALAGGAEGATGRLFLESGKPILSKGYTILEPGDCVVIQTPGGAGYGDPAERAPELLMSDRAAGLSTPALR